MAMLRFYDQVLDAPTRLRDGTHRAATLDETWRRFAPAARKAGITRIADITGLDTLGVPVFAAIRPMGKSLSTQQGKGASADAARVSALMESLETYSAENIEAKTVRGSYRALRKKHDVVDVRRLNERRDRCQGDGRIHHAARRHGSKRDSRGVYADIGWCHRSELGLRPHIRVGRQDPDSPPGVPAVVSIHRSAP